MTTSQKPLTGKKLVFRILLYVAIVVVCVVILYPYFIMLTSALKSRAEIYSTTGTIFPINWQWSNLLDVWKLAPMGRYFLNSLIVALGSTAIAMICGIPAAYALVRMKFKGNTVFLAIVIISQMFAPVVLLIGIYKVLLMFKLVNTLLGLILVNAAFNQAFTIWLLRGTFEAISPEMEQAASIDGCSRVQAMFKILLPIAAPGIVTALIFIFINAWNEYTVALTLISNDLLKPLTVGINIFNGYNMIEWQYLFGASLFSIIPVIVLFVMIEKNLVGGLASGGVKG